HFLRDSDGPSILISQGSGGHAYVFAEFGYHLHLAGYNVFIMPKHGGRTISELMVRHLDAVRFIRAEFSETVGLYGEGLGGYLVFYLALADAPVGSVVCQNSPAVMTEQAYHKALLNDAGPWAKSVRRRRLLLPVITRVARVALGLKVPVSSYLSWR